MPKLRKKISRDFTTIHNAMIRDIRLGATERGLLLTISQAFSHDSSAFAKGVTKRSPRV